MAKVDPAVRKLRALGKAAVWAGERANSLGKKHPDYKHLIALSQHAVGTIKALDAIVEAFNREKS